MAELNQNKKSQQPGWSDSVWKLYFILERNRNCLHAFYKMVVLKVKATLRKSRQVIWLLMENWFKNFVEAYHKKDFHISRLIFSWKL